MIIETYLYLPTVNMKKFFWQEREYKLSSNMVDLSLDEEKEMLQLASHLQYLLRLHRVRVCQSDQLLVQI